MLLARHLGDLDIQGRVLHVALFSIAGPSAFSTWPDFDKRENIQVLQVSGLCGAPFLSYLLKRFTQLYGASVCRHHTLMYQYSTPIWQLEIKKTSKNHF